MAERLEVEPDAVESLAVGSGHLELQTLDEYCFGRLSALEQAAAERHLLKCSICRAALVQQREFILCMKHALQDWTPSADIRPKTVPLVKPAPKFAPAMIEAARSKLPVSRLAGIEAMRLLENENTSLEQLDRVLKTDPVLSGHLIKVANSALLSYGQEARTVSQALARIGFERTKLHVCGLAVKKMFSTPQLQSIWNHSIQAAQVARQLASMTPGVTPDEASLLAIVHDIGHLVLAGLGQPYERARAQKIAAGQSAVEAEEELCGATHAAIGADLLAEWKFPPDMVEAIRFHHKPLERPASLAALLYVAEIWLDNGEDVCDPEVQATCLRRLGISVSDLNHLGLKNSPDLELLRFAA